MEPNKESVSREDPRPVWLAVPADLWRKVKAKAALKGQTTSVFVADVLRTEVSASDEGRKRSKQ